MEQKKLLMLGTSRASCEMIEYAKNQGIYTIVTDYFSPEESSAKLIADEYWMISTGDFDVLEEKCREERINGVCSGISTYCIPASIELSKRLGLQAYCTNEAWHYTMNKGDFKTLCRSCGVPVATDYFVSNPPTDIELKQIKFPVVVKAVDQSANRGMSYCFSVDEIIPAIEYAHRFSKDTHVIIERMLKGIEYTAYYALADGEASLVNLYTDLAQPGTPNNCYSVNSTVCNKLNLYLKEIDPYFKQALKKGGMTDGVCWIELILDEDGHFYVIEMGYRMSGDMMAIPIRDVTGFDSYKWMVDIALGKKHRKVDLPQEQTSVSKKCGCSYIMWSKNRKGVVERIEGIDKVLKMEGVYMDPKSIKEGSAFVSNQYMLIFTFTKDDVEGVIETIDKINQCVCVYDSTGEEVLLRFTDFENLRDLQRQ